MRYSEMNITSKIPNIFFSNQIYQLQRRVSFLERSKTFCNFDKNLETFCSI